MHPRRIFVLADSSTSHGRRILRGILDRVRLQHAPWRLRWDVTVRPEWLVGFDGLIGPFASSSATPLLPYLPAVPRVNVSSQRRLRGWWSVGPDNAAIGRLAAEVLRGRLHRAFAFCGIPAHRYSEERRRAFAEALGPIPLSVGEAVGRSGERAMLDWLRGLPRQTGIFAANDYVARQVVEAARQLGRDVPGDLAVLGVDAEEEIGLSTECTISSIDPDSTRIGFLAAAMLEDLLEGRRPASREVHVSPAGVVEAESTGGYAGDDRVLHQALRILRERFNRPLPVADLAREVGLSRRGLEVRFRGWLGRSPGDELRRLRMARACELLRGTTLPVGEVATRCGYADVYYFSAAFKKANGLNPTAFRRRPA